VAGASVIGTAHEKTGQPCQDAHGWRILPNNVLIAAVADGAGSAALGDVGAQVAVRAALEALEAHMGEPEDTLLPNVLAAVQEAVRQEANTREAPLRELATTLLFVLAGEQLVAAGQIGDGAIVVEQRDGELLTLTSPPADGYINETTFLTEDDAPDAAQWVMREEGVRRIALFTDGLQRLALKLPEGEPHAPFFAPLFRFIAEQEEAAAPEKEIAALLRSPRISDRTADDLTLLLAAWILSK
jgi:hypothetical protein